jgi:hypothetical protein
MNSFDLNISNYTINELEKMLELRNGYTKAEIITQTTIFKDKVLGENNMPISKKNDIVEFLNKASDKIIKKLTLSLEKTQDDFTPAFEKMTNTIIPGNSSSVVIEKPSVVAGLNWPKFSGRLIDNADQPPGIINPINVRTIKRTINLDTRFRPNYYNTSSTDFSLTLPVRVKNAVSMRIASIEIPISWYTVAKYWLNSFFKIEWGDNGDGTFAHNYTVTIPDGNYELFWQASTEATDLASTINTFMHAYPGTGIGKTILQDIVFNVDRTSGRSGFAWKSGSPYSTQNFKISFSIDENGNSDFSTILQFRLGWLLGFRVGFYEGPSIVSEGICYMKGPRYAFICINDFNNSVSNYFISAFSSSLLQKDIIARINLTYIQQQQGVYQTGQDDGLSTQINRQRSYFGPVDIERLEIKLLDEFGRVIDLNNMDWSMALTMECLYDT